MSRLHVRLPIFGLVFSVALLAAMPSAAVSTEPPTASVEAVGPAVEDPAVASLLARFDSVQAAIHTLSADFTDVQKNKLLKDPIVMKGHFFLTKPHSVLWQVTAPEEMRFVVANDEYVGYFPKRKRAEHADIRRWSEQVFRFVGLGQGSKELGKLYTIRVEDPGPEWKGARLLVLDPKKRRMRKNVDEVRLWVDDTSLLPLAVEYRGQGGNLRSIRFSNTRVNPALAENLYKVDIPADFTVSKGFSGLTLTGKEN